MPVSRKTAARPPAKATARTAGTSQTVGIDDIAVSTDILVDQWTRERPDLDMRAFALTLRITGLAMLIGQFGEKVAKSVGLRYGEMLLLHALRREGEPYVLRPTDILKLMKVTSGTVTYRVDRLEKMGVVRRIADPEDRRSMMIQLTEQGVGKIDEAVRVTVEQASVDLRQLVGDDAAFVDATTALRRINAAYDASMSAADNPLIHQSPKRK
jgi:DNA-binding MarR family transcriptional regulator